MNMARCHFLTLALLGFAGTADAEPSPPPAPPTAIGPVTSTNQGNGVTAGYVGTVQIMPQLVRGPQLEHFKDTFTLGARIFAEMRRVDLTDEQIDALANAADAWANGTYFWLQKDVSPYAAERFNFRGNELSFSYSLPGEHKPGFAERRNNVINGMAPLLSNLDMLMRDPSIYPQR